MARTLFSYWRSSASYRVRIALALKEIEYEMRAANPQNRRTSQRGFPRFELRIAALLLGTAMLRCTKAWRLSNIWMNHFQSPGYCR
jgi:hypothetical protein